MAHVVASLLNTSTVGDLLCALTACDGSNASYDPCVQLLVHQLLRLGEVTECDFGGVFTLAH